MKGFLEFIREQGVMGLAVGFILGGSVSKIVTAFVNDLVSPIIGIALGRLDLKHATLNVFSAKIMWGDFVSVAIDFLIIAMIVYYGVKILKLDKLDKKKA